MNAPNIISPISREIVKQMLDAFCGNHTNFTANQRFYKATCINAHRWGKLFRGEASITMDELAALCKYLKVDFSAKTFLRQLKLFDNTP